MLPFLKQKTKDTGVIVHDRRPDSTEEEPQQESPEIVDIIKDCIVCYSTNDIAGLAEHVKLLHDALHEHMDQEKESSNTNFALQNARAAKQE